MNLISIRKIKTLVLVVSALLAIWACNLGGEAKTEEVFTFPTMADSLKGSDRALIYLTDAFGEVIDTLFNGPITPATRFENLAARRYQGGKVIVVVEGYKDGVVFYKLQKTYDGANSKVDNTVIVIARPVVPNPNPNPGPATPADSVRIFPDTLKVMANGLKGVLAATVYPDTLAQNVTWNSLDGAIATVSTSGVVSGLQAGVARIVATSARGGRNADTAFVVVSAAVKVESVKFDRAVLEIYLGGSAEPLVVQVLPLGVNPEVVFHIAESGVVEILDGKVKGLKEGQTTVTARSIVDTSLSATLKVVVLPKSSDPVDSVVVAQDTLRLYTGGESLSLTATIHPKSQPARFSWRTASQAIAVVDTAGKVSPIAPGKTYVSAISRVDSTRRDSAVVLVKKDPPRIQIGGDTTIAAGSILTYLPYITQDYGLTTLIRWDLDGNGAWDDSSAAPKTVSYNYAVAKEYLTRFSARDSEGNDTTVTRRVRAVSGPVIQITLPADGFHTNQSPVMITWSVDGATQSSPETLKVGANIVIRSAKSATGETFSDSITVNYDITPPGRPLVTGPVGPVSNMRPAWSWQTGGGGNGSYRFRLDIDNFTTGATMSTDTAFTPAANLTVGPHTLYAQERDQAGNWSPSGSFTVRIDTTPPAPPVVTVLPASPTSNTRPAWSWTGSAAEGKATYRYKLDNNDFRTGAVTVFVTGFTPAVGSELLEGPHTLYVQQQDSAGNWSNPGSAAVTVDLSAPAMPRVSVLSNTVPTFSWISGGGGSGKYQVKMNSNNFATGAIDVAAGVTTYSPTGLPEGKQVIYVREADAAGNWSMPDSESVWLDKTNPTITNPGNKTITTTSTTLTFSAADGAGTGVKTASCRWGTTTVAADFSGGTWSCAVSGLNTVQTTVTLEAVDGVGLKGTATLSITVNLPVQQVVVTPKFQKYATALTYVTVDYTVDGVPKKIDFTSLKLGRNILEIVGPENALRQVSKDTALIYSWPSVVFVNKHATGNRTGKSWDDAYTEASEVLNSTKGLATGTNVWITSGTYGFVEGATTFWIGPGIKVYGGFPNDGSGIDSTFRNLNNPTVFTDVTNFGSLVTLRSNTTFENFILLQPEGNINTGAISATGDDININNIVAEKWGVGDHSFVSVGGKRIVFRSSSFSDGTSAYGTFLIIGPESSVDFYSTKIDNNDGILTGYQFAVVEVRENARVRMLQGSSNKGSDNFEVPMPPFSLDLGAELAISSTSTVDSGITGGFSGTGKSCIRESLPCP